MIGRHIAYVWYVSVWQCCFLTSHSTEMQPPLLNVSNFDLENLKILVSHLVCMLCISWLYGLYTTNTYSRSC